MSHIKFALEMQGMWWKMARHASRCCYFLPGPRLPSQPRNITALGRYRHKCVWLWGDLLRDIQRSAERSDMLRNDYRRPS